METPDHNPAAPLRLPEGGAIMTEAMKAAWTYLDIASHGYSHNMDDPKKRELFHRAIENYNRAYREAAEQYRTQASRPETPR